MLAIPDTDIFDFSQHIEQGCKSASKKKISRKRKRVPDEWKKKRKPVDSFTKEREIIIISLILIVHSFN